MLWQKRKDIHYARFCASSCSFKSVCGRKHYPCGSNKKLGILKGIPEFCRDNNMFACALTDTNMMSGCAEFSDVMPANKLQPIIGVEISLNHHSADPKILRQSSLSKIVLLAKHHKGYLNLCELSRIMYMRTSNHHLGPYVTMAELKKYSDDLICLSGAHTGPIGMAILNNQIIQHLISHNNFRHIR